MYRKALTSHVLFILTPKKPGFAGDLKIIPNALAAPVKPQ
jgi:hypothetical protein